MEITEAEARKLPCVGPEQCGKSTRDTSISTKIVMGPRLCVGSECIAWRWVCTMKVLIYENGDGFEEMLPSDRLGVCGVVDPITKPYKKSVNMLPKRSV